MTRMTTGLPLVYRPDKAHVWVEDAITRQYLQELWQDAGIVFHVGGGGPVIRAVAHDATSQGVGTVVGVMDRDFGDTNFAQWTNPASTARVMVLPVHEIENYLLDADALSGCALNNRGRSAAEVEAYVRNTAALCEWQVAASQVIASWRREFQADFPGHPTRDEARDRATALAHLTALPWARDWPGSWRRNTSASGSRAPTPPSAARRRSRWSSAARSITSDGRSSTSRPASRPQCRGS